MTSEMVIAKVINMEYPVIMRGSATPFPFSPSFKLSLRMRKAYAMALKSKPTHMMTVNFFFLCLARSLIDRAGTNELSLPSKRLSSSLSI